jgi:hypothetical protein
VLFLADQAPDASFSSLLSVLLIGGVIFTFGFRLAVMRRANADYKATKAAVPKLRKGFWAALWAMVRFAALVAVALIALFAWVVHEARTIG